MHHLGRASWGLNEAEQIWRLLLADSIDEMIGLAPVENRCFPLKSHKADVTTSNKHANLDQEGCSSTVQQFMFPWLPATLSTSGSLGYFQSCPNFRQQGWSGHFPELVTVTYGDQGTHEGCPRDGDQAHLPREFRAISWDHRWLPENWGNLGT